MESVPTPFFVKNCSMTAIATGDRANSLMELRDKLAFIDESSIYHHFWGGRLKPQFIHTQHHNDFASWAFNRLHDQVLAERLSIIDPTEFENLEKLRQELLEVIERRLDDYEVLLWTTKEDRFNFIRSTLIVFDSNIIISKPEDLVKVIPLLPLGSVFYHLIDARGRTSEHIDDFSLWLNFFGDKHQPLIKDIQAIDPFFLSLSQLKDELSYVVLKHF